jgi:hypothetical protein
MTTGVRGGHRGLTGSEQRRCDEGVGRNAGLQSVVDEKRRRQQAWLDGNRMGGGTTLVSTRGLD